MVCGRSVVDPAVVEQRCGSHNHNAGLGARELDVLREMAEGRTNTSIAERLHLSESASEKYIGTIFTKLNLGEERRVSRRVAAVLTYLRDPDGTGPNATGGAGLASG